MAYRACDTQWRVGVNGATGLDGAACVALLERMLPKWRKQDALDDVDMADVLEDLHVIELATLESWREQRDVKPEPQA